MIYIYCLYSTWVGRGGGGWEGGGRVGRKQYLTIEVFQYMFLLYYFIKAMGWGGGGADLIILVICTFWGVRGGGGAGLPVYSLY